MSNSWWLLLVLSVALIALVFTLYGKSGVKTAVFLAIAFLLPNLGYVLFGKLGEYIALGSIVIAGIVIYIERKRRTRRM